MKYLKKYFKYHSDGTLSRSDRKGGHGSLDKDGYLIIKIKGKQYKSHRLVFALCKDRFPMTELDHIDGNKLNNKIENLREVTRRQNIMNKNQKPNSRTGYPGVHLDTTKGLKKKYAVHLGDKTFRFYSPEEAYQKRRNHYGNLCST